MDTELPSCTLNPAFCEILGKIRQLIYQTNLYQGHTLQNIDATGAHSQHRSGLRINFYNIWDILQTFQQKKNRSY